MIQVGGELAPVSCILLNEDSSGMCNFSLRGKQLDIVQFIHLRAAYSYAHHPSVHEVTIPGQAGWEKFIRGKG
jgi:hypothetical protein